MGARPALVRSAVHGLMRALDASPDADKVGPRFIDPRVDRARVPQFTGGGGDDGSGPGRSDGVFGRGDALLIDGAVTPKLREQAAAVTAR